MKRILYVLLLYFVSLNSNNAMASASSEFKQYIDQMIPLSFRLAEQEASIRESALFIQKLSEVQTHLAVASDAAVSLEKLLDTLQKTPTPECSQRVANPALLKRWLYFHALLSEIVNIWEFIQKERDGYLNIVRTYEQICGKGFDSYRVEMMNLAIRDLNIETADGIYIDFSNPISLVVTSIQSLIQILDNGGEARRIHEEKRRYERDSVQDQDYQNFAKKACNNYQAKFESYLKEYSKIDQRLEKLLQKIDVSEVKKTAAVASSYIESYPEQLQQQIQEKIRANALRMVEPEHRRGLKLILEGEVNHKMVFAVYQLSKSPCGKGMSWIDEIKDNISVSKKFLLDNSELVQKSKEFLDQRKRSCGGAFL